MTAPLDLHELFQAQEACGYDFPLPANRAQALASSLRGINANPAGLMADTGEVMKLGNWLQGGLLEAVHRLAWDATVNMEHANDYARKQAERGQP